MTFIGQAMASIVMPYQMMNMEGMNTPTHDMANMNNSHNMTNDVADDESKEDCCATSCNCILGGCSSLTALLKDISSTANVELANKIVSISSLVQSRQLTSLYRPPIIS
ncbi:MAG: hypothetical protein HRT52_15935 [Colwellia sp.]|nr:hypothetical protein [Colwellia sp.]